jgi:hypothetical protein
MTVHPVWPALQRDDGHVTPTEHPPITPDAGSWCELCGRHVAPGSGFLGRLGARDRLDWCAACGVLACERCRPEPHRCVGCSDLPARSHPAARAARWRLGAAVLGIVVVMSIALASVLGGRGPNGAILGATSAPDRVVSGSPGSGARGGGSADRATGNIAVVGRSVRVWEDVLGARHGEAIFVLHNGGSAPLEVVPTKSTFSVRTGTAEVATGALRAAIPPVIEPGDRGYAVGMFTLPAPAADLDALTSLAVRRPDGTIVGLGLKHVALVTAGATAGVRGTARNATDHRARDGVVGAVALAASGDPLFAVLDEASAGVLAAGAERPFHAAYPPVVQPDPSTIADVVAFGWARSSSPSGSSSP